MKKRLDIALTERGLTSSREKAKSLITKGSVLINGQKAQKPNQQVEDADLLTLADTGPRFVSRGGYKLLKAIDSFGLTLSGFQCMDIGASTGGFTDCMLQHGASRVYAVDVGTGQLAEILKSDDRVINLERTNIRQLEGKELESAFDFISIDVSFISLTLVLPQAIRFLKPQAQLVCLVKPQFEAGKGNVGKNGVVRGARLHRQVLLDITEFAFQLGFGVLKVDFSPIKGPEGNIEYLLLLQKGTTCRNVWEEEIKKIVARSHEQLDSETGGEHV